MGATSANAEYDNGKIKIENDLPSSKFLENHQALHWFDKQGNLVAKQGEAISELPVSMTEKVQFNNIGKYRIQSVTLPIIGNDDKQLIGYVRASQSLGEYEGTLHKLDLGLGGGIVVALIISGFGSVWLTRQAMHPIEESFKRLQQFTADASHELRC